MLPSQEELMRIFAYDPETGELRRRSTGALITARSKGRGGKPGHIQVSVHNKVRYAHRVIWKMIMGEDPPAEVDHRDCDPGNNRWSNLRASDRRTNSANRGRNRNNSSGFKGVYLHQCGRWTAGITANRKSYYLGLFDTPEEAHAAYAKAADQLFGEFARAA